MAEVPAADWEAVDSEAVADSAAEVLAADSVVEGSGEGVDWAEVD